MKKLIIFSGFIVFTLSLFAQGYRKWEGFEEFRAKKATFITEKLQLTPEEAQQFWPHYNKFEDQRMKLQKRKREIEKNAWENLDHHSEKDFKRIYDELTEIEDQTYKLKKEYRKKFLEILPAKKALTLEYIEHQFRSQMLREYRKRKRADD